MKILENSSLKTRLVASFAGVVVFAALISTVVFSVVLVSTMKKSSREKIAETSKVALTHIDDIVRGLETYSDLIASDMTFGQLLSFDSAMAISQKMDEFTKLSKADVVVFIPRAEQYVQIKDQIFTNMGTAETGTLLKKNKTVLSLTEPTASDSKKGWIQLGEDLFLYSMKPVLHFGSNMGVIFLGKKCNESLIHDMATATGTEITLFNSSKIFGSSLQNGSTSLTEIPNQKVYSSLKENSHLEENFPIGGKSYLSYFVPIRLSEGEQIGTLALQSSNESIQEARNQTLSRVLIVALLATLFSAFIGFLLARAISNPLLLITNGIRSIMEKGDLSIRVPHTIGGGEIGILSNSFNGLLEQLHDAHEKLAASERRMKLELTSASTVQEMLFPEKSVDYGKMELASFIDTSTETGGDWFGYGKDRIGDNVTVLIGDVTGHGMPAALITAITNGFFTGVQEVEDSLRQALSELKVDSFELQGILKQEKHLTTGNMLEILNQIILRSTRGNLLMTFFASTFDATQNLLRYSNAGHNRPFHVRPMEDGKPKISVLPSDPSQRLGETMDIKFPENSIEVKPGDLLIWYTDGLLECENPSGEMYGKRRLMNILGKYYQQPTSEIVKAIIEDSYRFFGGHPRKDDITLVVGKAK